MLSRSMYAVTDSWNLKELHNLINLEMYKYMCKASSGLRNITKICICMKHHLILTSETFINMYLFAKRKTNYRENFLNY